MVVHTVFDLIGMIPALGNIADGLNAAIYLAQGDLANAAMSAVALLPLGGAAAAVGKLASKYGGDVARGLLKHGDTLVKAVKSKADDVAAVVQKLFKKSDDAMGIVADYSDEVSDAVKRCTDGNCFIAGTLVLTSDGYKKIEDIKVGDKVIATDPETGETTEKEVVDTFINEANELVHITVNGETIITTPEHPFYVPEKGWTEAADLRAGDMLVLVNGEYVIIEKIQHEFLEEPITVYNFEVEDFHTYYVGEQSMLVHNRCGGEIIEKQVSTYEQARNRAQEILGDLGYDSKPYIGRLENSAGYGQVVGRQTADGRARWRLDFDTELGPHINVEDFRLGKGSSALKIAIPFLGDENTVISYLRHLNR